MAIASLRIDFDQLRVGITGAQPGPALARFLYLDLGHMIPWRMILIDLWLKATRCLNIVIF
jgi:hypothetical protein